jgi:hypothetical protein
MGTGDSTCGLEYSARVATVSDISDALDTNRNTA